MNAETRNLGLDWINCTISSDSRHPLDTSRFDSFVNSLRKEHIRLVPSDIESMIIECDKQWPQDIIEDFIAYWYSRYDAQI